MFNQCCTTVSQEKLDRCLSIKQMLELQNELNSHLPAGDAWNSFYSVDHMTTAIISELAEVLDDTGMQWKHWGTPKDPTLFNVDMLKMEMVDIVHFWLSIAIIRLRGDLADRMTFCSPTDEFAMYDKVYVGDMGQMQPIGLYNEPNSLIHSNFVQLARLIICGQREMDAYSWVNTLGAMASSVGLSCEELGAYYTAKHELNRIRWDHPDWQKQPDPEGLTDNERTIALINDYMADSTMTLVVLRENVVTEFYGDQTAA